MVEKQQIEMDLLDIFVSLNRGLNISDVMFQLNNLYAPKGEKVEQDILLEVLNSLTEKGYLKTNG